MSCIVNDKKDIVTPVEYVDNPCCDTDGVADYCDCGFSVPSGTTSLDVEWSGVYHSSTVEESIVSERPPTEAYRCFDLAINASGKWNPFVYRAGVAVGTTWDSALVDGAFYEFRFLADDTGTYAYANGTLIDANTDNLDPIDTPEAVNINIAHRPDSSLFFSGEHHYFKLTINGENYCEHDFSETSGDVVFDKSGNGRHGNLVGTLATLRIVSDDAPAHAVEGGFTPATSFDGNSWVSTGTSVPSGSTTIRASGRFTVGAVGEAANQALQGEWATASDSCYIVTILASTNVLRAQVFRSGTQIGLDYDASPLELGETYTYELLADSSGTYLSVGGTIVESNTTNTDPIDTPELQEITIGASSNGAGRLIGNAHYAKVEVDGVVIHHVRPSRKDVTKMVDLVTGDEYSNDGTGDLDRVDIPASTADTTKDATGGELYYEGSLMNGAQRKLLWTDETILGETSFWSTDGVTFDRKSWADFASWAPYALL